MSIATRLLTIYLHAMDSLMNIDGAFFCNDLIYGGLVLVSFSLSSSFTFSHCPGN